MISKRNQVLSRIRSLQTGNGVFEDIFDQLNDIFDDLADELLFEKEKVRALITDIPSDNHQKLRSTIRKTHVIINHMLPTTEDCKLARAHFYLILDELDQFFVAYEAKINALEAEIQKS